MSNNNRKIKSVKGFVMNRKSGHPSLAYHQRGEQVKSIGFTHNEKDKEEKIPLSENINPKDKRKCYVKIKIERQRSKDYRIVKAYSEYRVAKQDKHIIEFIIKQKKR